MYQSKRKVVNVNNISKPEVLWCRILPTTIPVNLWHSVPKKKKIIVLTRYIIQYWQIFADSSYTKERFPVVALH